MAGPTLAQYISRKRIIPTAAHGTHWKDDGNIILVADTKVFKTYKAKLTVQSREFERVVGNMNDGTVDVVEGCPVLPLGQLNAVEIGWFLDALFDDQNSFPLDTKEDFDSLAGILVQATRFKADKIRRSAIAALQKRYPTNLSRWDQIRPYKSTRTEDASWEWDRALIINLARNIEAFSILPSAMAMLTNDCSAGEVFGIRDPDLFPTTQTRTLLNNIDAPFFAAMKEHNHRSIVSLLRFIRSLGASCTRPPDLLPYTAGLAPIGAPSLRPVGSLCASKFKEIASELLEMLVLERPVGYAEFVGSVKEVGWERRRMCKYCWRDFLEGVEKKRKGWWEGLPGMMGFTGWDDERLANVE